MKRKTLLKILQVSLLMTFTANGYAGESCGSKEGYLNQLTSQFLIPDSFPPETELLRSLISDADLERCERINVISLSASCEAHDGCYEQRFDKNSCDKSLQDSWVKSCRSSYYKLTFESQGCRLACESFVKLMSEAQRYDGNGFCPSCEAYNNSNME